MRLGDLDLPFGDAASHDLVGAVRHRRGLRHRALREAHLDAATVKALGGGSNPIIGAEQIAPKGETVPDERRRVRRECAEDFHPALHLAGGVQCSSLTITPIDEGALSSLAVTPIDDGALSISPASEPQGRSPAGRSRIAADRLAAAGWRP
jgi:hypothetical protein